MNPLKKSDFSKYEQLAIYTAAALTCILSFVIIYYPLQRIIIERNERGDVIKSTTETLIQKELAILFSASSIALFLFGINGFRLTKFTVGYVSAETKPTEAEMAKDYAKQKETPEEITIKEDTPAAAVDPTTDKGSVTINNETEAVYPLTSVPLAVLEGLLKNWPAKFKKPEDLSAFEFATKKKGKGNHPWTVKFAGNQAIKISFGGKGKEGPTISNNRD